MSEEKLKLEIANRRNAELENEMMIMSVVHEIEMEEAQRASAPTAPAISTDSPPTPKLIDSNHALKPLIEQAMKNINVGGFGVEGITAVWHEMSGMVLLGEHQCSRTVTGFVAGKGIEYRGKKFQNSGKMDRGFNYEVQLRVVFKGSIARL